jgi:hypothetical protein
LKLVRLALVTTLLFALILWVCPSVQADEDKAEVELKVEIVPPPRPPAGGGGGGAPAYYLLVNLWGEKFRVRVTTAGEVKADLEAVSVDEMLTIRIAEGVSALTIDEQRLEEIEVWQMAQPPPLPENGYIIGIAYDFNPDGATFEPPIELEIRYDPSQIPSGLDEQDLLIAYYDVGAAEWIELDSVVNTLGNTVTAKVRHFTPFAILGYRVVPAPAAFTVSKLFISPTEVDIGQSVTISAIVTNTGGQPGTYKVVLKINGAVEATEEVTVSAGASKKVSFTTARYVAGSYSVDVNGLSGSFAVKKPAPPPPEEPVKPPINWPMVGGIIAAVVAASAIVFFWIRRRTQ